ncbi:serine/threonine-protein kinase, partial [Aquipuribacter hungaricus]
MSAAPEPGAVGAPAGAAAPAFAGRYRFVDLLGSGGMGSVWRVWDTREARYVAAKVLRHARADSLLRFVAEQSTRVRDPHVLTPLGWTADDDRVLFTMELVDGGSVADLVGDHGALPAAAVVELLDQLLEALGAVHEAGVVHRDVTPANLLLRATGTGRPHLLLSDFGVAVRADLPRLTSTGEVVGTPGYLAPELLRGDDPAPASDLYAAGVVAVEALTGLRPGPKDGSDDVVGRLEATAAPWPVRAVVRSLLEVDPARRPPGAGEARARLLHAAAGSEDLLRRPLRDAGGDPLEVLRQLPPLPEGWGPGGPDDSRGGTAPTATVSPPAPAPAPVALPGPTGPPPQPAARAQRSGSPLP